MVDPLAKICTRCGAHYDASAAFCTRDGTPLGTESEEPDLYVGQTLLGQFRIEEKVGAGGMGTVYRARQIGVDRHVAIKILHPELVQNADAVRRFQREARVSAALDHPNVVRVILFGQLPDGALYLIMEYLEGRSLSDLIRIEGALPPARALHITTQICDAIGEAHQQGVVHRDVKPENVHLVTRGRDLDFVKVLDFGIARFLWGEQTMVTQSGLIFGTARYISPEGAAGETTDARSDVYSIGVLCYQLLCGETPFDSPSPVALLMKHIHEPAQDVRGRARGGQVPAAVADVIARALAKNPDARFDDAIIFAEALRAAASSAGLPLGGARRATAASLVPPDPQRAAAHAPAHAAAHGPAGRAARAVHASDTLAAAPSPYGSDASMGGVSLPNGMSGRAIAGLSRRPRATVLIGAFFLGAVAVGGGAMLARSLGGSEQVSLDRSELARRARAALDAGAYDAEGAAAPGENVRDLTDRLLLADPRDQDALALRAAATTRLVAVADRTRGDLRWAEARAVYERALLISPNEAQALQGLTIVEQHEHAAVVVAGVRTLPAVPQAGETVTLVAALEAGTTVDVGAEPHFHVTRAGRALRGEVPATRGTDGGFVGSFTFPQAGEYSVFFVVHEGEQRVQMRAEVVVTADGGARRVAVRDRRRNDGDSPMVLTHQQLEPVPPTVIVTPTPTHDGIDWNVPRELQNPPPGGASPGDRTPGGGASGGGNSGGGAGTTPSESGGATVTAPTPTPTSPPPSPPAPPAPWTGQPI